MYYCVSSPYIIISMRDTSSRPLNFPCNKVLSVSINQAYCFALPIFQPTQLSYLGSSVECQTRTLEACPKQLSVLCVLCVFCCAALDECICILLSFMIVSACAVLIVQS